jgi:hypothetical protein
VGTSLLAIFFGSPIISLSKPQPQDISSEGEVLILWLNLDIDRFM